MLPLYSYTYGIPYCLILIIAFIGSYYEKFEATRTKAILFFGVLMVIFFGFRGYVQTDCIVYYNIFDYIPVLWDFDWSEYTVSLIEPGFFLYSMFVKSIYPDFQFWVFVNTVLDIVVLTWFFKRYSQSVLLSWIFFFIFSGLVIEINLYRNVKAIALFLLAIPYLQQRQFFKFFLLWLAALTFHASAILYLPTYFILTKNWGKMIPLVVLILVNIVFFLKLYPTTFIMNTFLTTESQFIEKAVYYISNAKEQGITLGYIERLAVYLLSLIYGNKLISYNKANRIFINSFYIYYLLWYIFSDVTVFVERFPPLFAYSYWILLPNFLYICRPRYKQLIYTATFLFCMAKIFILTDHILYRYDNQLFGIESLEKRIVDKERYMLNR